MIFTLMYILMLFFIFNKIDLIKGIDLIKDYIKIIIFGLFPMIYKVATNYNKVNVIQMSKEILKFSIIPLFIIGEYTFNIFLELFLVLTATIFTLLITVSGSKPEFKKVKSFLNWCLGLMGICVIIYGFRNFFLHISDVQKIIFWKKMLLELLLLCHIPLLLFLQIASYYKNIIIRIKIKSQLLSNTKGKIKVLYILLKNCHFNKNRLEVALNKINRNGIDSYQGLNDILSETNNNFMSY
jgi:hypothetical protein